MGGLELPSFSSLLSAFQRLSVRSLFMQCPRWRVTTANKVDGGVAGRSNLYFLYKEEEPLRLRKWKRKQGRGEQAQIPGWIDDVDPWGQFRMSVRLPFQFILLTPNALPLSIFLLLPANHPHICLSLFSLPPPSSSVSSASVTLYPFACPRLKAGKGRRGMRVELGRRPNLN